MASTLVAIYMQVRDARSAALHDHAQPWDDEWNSHDFEALRSPVGRHWSLLEPWLVEERQRRALPLLDRFERLELEMRKLDRRAVGRDLDWTTDRVGLAAAIEQLEAYLHVMIDERNGILPSAARRQVGEPDGAAGAA